LIRAQAAVNNARQHVPLDDRIVERPVDRHVALGGDRHQAAKLGSPGGHIGHCYRNAAETGFHEQARSVKLIAQKPFGGSRLVAHGLPPIQHGCNSQAATSGFPRRVSVGFS
jgi:hypothetical protein